MAACHRLQNGRCSHFNVAEARSLLRWDKSSCSSQKHPSIILSMSVSTYLPYNAPVQFFTAVSPVLSTYSGESHLCVCQFPLYDPQVSNGTNMPKCHAGIPVPLTPIKTQRGSTILPSRFLLLSNLWKIYNSACCSQRSDLLKATSIIYRERKPDTNASRNKDLSRNYSLWFWVD